MGAFAAAFTHNSGLQFHQTMISKFDRVADQIQQHLPQSKCRTCNHPNRTRFGAIAQRQPLGLRQRGLAFQHVLCQIVEIQRHIVTLDAPAFQPRNVQHVGDMMQQQFARFLHDFDNFGLFSR